MTMMRMMRSTVAVTMRMRAKVCWFEKARHEGFCWVQRHGNKFSVQTSNTNWMTFHKICKRMRKREKSCLFRKSKTVKFDAVNCHYMCVNNLNEWQSPRNTFLVFVHDFNNETKSTEFSMAITLPRNTKSVSDDKEKRKKKESRKDLGFLCFETANTNCLNTF